MADLSQNKNVDKNEIIIILTPIEIFEEISRPDRVYRKCRKFKTTLVHVFKNCRPESATSDGQDV